MAEYQRRGGGPARGDGEGGFLGKLRDAAAEMVRLRAEQTACREREDQIEAELLEVERARIRPVHETLLRSLRLDG